MTTSKIKYQIAEEGVATEDFSERRLGLEMPVMVGIKLGPVRANAGPVFRTGIANYSELTQVSDYGRKFRESQAGLQAGIGFDLGKKVILDFRYEIDLSATRDDIEILGQTHELSQHGGQLSASLGYSF